MVTLSVAALGRIVLTLTVAAALGATLGILRPVRREIVPRSMHVVHAQILLAMVGALIMVIVADSLPTAFAIVGAAGLVRYRAPIKDPKDAGVMLVALTVGLATGKGLFLAAIVGTFLIIAVLWLLESIEPPAHSRFNLSISTRHAPELQAAVEHAMIQHGLRCDLRGSSRSELRYEVVVPFAQDIRKLSKILTELDGQDGTSIEWEVKKYKTVAP